jgi:uncharacterized membrane protein
MSSLSGQAGALRRRLPAIDFARVRPAAARTAAWARAEAPVLVLTVLAAVVYSLWAIWKHVHFGTEFDLGIFDQSTWLMSRFHLPDGTINGPTVLGEHFSPLLVLAAPFYWFWADAKMLLILQSVLFAASIVPVYLYARPRMGTVGSYALAVAYALFWPIAAAVDYQAHEIMFAPLLIALAILFADRERWRAFWISAGLLLLVKEDMATVVAALGVWLMLRREYKRGAIALAAGLAWFGIAGYLLIPLFNGGTTVPHWTYTAFGDDPPSAIAKIMRYPGLLTHYLTDDPVKVQTLVKLFAPFLLLVLYSPLVVVCIPIIAESLYSSESVFWGTHLHHWVPIAPVIAMGAADGLRNLLRLARREPQLRWIGGVVGVVILVANFTLAKKFPLWNLTQGVSYSVNASEKARYHAIEHVTDGGSVATNAMMLPHLSTRRGIYLLGNPEQHPGCDSRCLPHATDWVVVKRDEIGWPNPDVANAWLAANKDEYRRVFYEDGWEVLRKR